MESSTPCADPSRTLESAALRVGRGNKLGGRTKPMKLASTLTGLAGAITLMAGALLAMTDLDENWDRVVASSACWLDRAQPMALQDQEPVPGFLTLTVAGSGRSIRIHYSAQAPGYISIWNHSSRGYVARLVPGPSADVSSTARSMPVAPGTTHAITGYVEFAGEEKVIALWTREAPAQLREHHFRCKRVFARSLADLRGRSASDWAIKTVTLRVN